MSEGTIVEARAGEGEEQAGAGVGAYHGEAGEGERGTEGDRRRG